MLGIEVEIDRLDKTTKMVLLKICQATRCAKLQSRKNDSFNDYHPNEIFSSRLYSPIVNNFEKHYTFKNTFIILSINMHK